ncbi:colony stimulating factor 3 (granulocyte) a [Brachyhypopomus gauderio]|uniref:colony stimulating factor 3 (granulocyte) a n=1 Tax=Brachyhypopomus gauderio TaxID=698409 RepID=UPI0040414805
MYIYLGSTCLALCILVASVGSAPIMQDSEFQDTVENGHSLITKILDDIPAVHKSWIYAESMSLDEIDKFQYLREQLNIPDVPGLIPISDDLDACLIQISEVLRLHRALLKVISNKMTSTSTSADDLRYDIRDLLSVVHKMWTLTKRPAGSVWPAQAVSDGKLEAELGPRLSTDYKVQVAAHLVLVQLRQFGQEVQRSLHSLLDPGSLGVQTLTL